MATVKARWPGAAANPTMDGQNMRFLLIHPYYPISECPSPPLGLAFLGGALERDGIETRVLDLVVNKYHPEMLEAALNDFQPDVVGITAVTMTANHALEVVTEVKRIAPHVITVMGGPHVTFCAAETMAQCPALDYVVLGEGEDAIVELTRAVEKGRDMDSVAGLALRHNGHIVFTKHRPPGIDVDTLPIPARHLLPLGRYRALGLAISMTTSRGCPHQCIFCVGRQMVGAKVRYRNPIAVVDEMEYLATLNFSQINLADDLFTANKKHCHAVCDEILRRGLKVKWTSFARVDTVSLEVLTRMKEAGCTAVSFGVESGVQAILDTIKKKITLEQIVAAVKMCNEAGVSPMASFILGLPGETPETMKQTMEFGQKLNDLGVGYGFHLLAPFPGTKVRDDHEKYGIKILTDDWSQYHANRAIVETETVSREMLDEVAIHWERQFDEYLGMLKDRYVQGEIDEQEAWPILNLERTVMAYDLMMDRVIEKQGTWPSDGQTSVQALARLASRVQSVTGKPQDLIDSTLRQAWDRKAIHYADDGRQAKWAWVDYI